MNKLGIELSQVEAQLIRLREGFSPIPLLRPCTIGDGILSFSSAQLESFVKIYDEKIAGLGRAMKFVPASGAASRMFQDLLELRCELRAQVAISQESEKSLSFFSSLNDFPFYESLEFELNQQHLSLKECLQQKQYLKILDALLGPGGLDYDAAPKALIPFHRYPDEVRTALEEHCVEAQDYLASSRKSCRLHLTVPEDFLEKIKEFARSFLQKPNFRHFDYQIDFSVQNAATHSLAVDRDYHPLRHAEGTLVFRPAGHGALLQNLDALQADIVFIKNIDNVVDDSRRVFQAFYKKALGGILASVQEKIFGYLQRLQRENPSYEIIDAMFEELAVYFSDLRDLKFEHPEEKKKCLNQRLNRPLRVCGMVRNTGKPGGGPFWVQMKDGSVLPQIVESAQIDFDQPTQKEILQTATHFNPVDIVCAVRDFWGQPFSLADYVNSDWGLVVKKSLGGICLQSLELPGLWNGGMAYWNSIFVEVPEETFCPVKTLWDLNRGLPPGLFKG